MDSLVLAAVVGIEAGQSRPSAPVPWGWVRPALPRDPSRNAYLARLADDTGEWFARRPDKAPGLVRRLGDFPPWGARP